MRLLGAASAANYCHGHVGEVSGICGTLRGVPNAESSQAPPARAGGQPDNDKLPSAPKFRTDRSHYHAALEHWMQGRFPERQSLTVADLESPVSTGFSNETVILDAAWSEDGSGRHERYVVRIEPADGGMFPPQTPHCAVSVELQYRAMKAVSEAGVAPVPPLFGYEPDPAVLGSPFFVMGFVPGRIPADVPRYTESGFVVDEATPGQRRRMVLSAIDTIAGIHSLDWRNGGLGWLDPSATGQPTTTLQIDLYRNHVRSELAGREHPVLYAALDWLEANDPGDERVGLTWGDARLGNIILQDYRTAAVLDWEVCALSPTEADVGWWLMFDRMSFDDLGIDRLEGYPTRSEMISRYEQVSGRTVRDARYWEVFGAMRFCTIFIRLGDRLAAAGFVPPERNPAVGNQVTAALAVLLGIDNPTPDLMAR